MLATTGKKALLPAWRSARTSPSVRIATLPCDIRRLGTTSTPNSLAARSLAAASFGASKVRSTLTTGRFELSKRHGFASAAVAEAVEEPTYAAPKTPGSSLEDLRYFLKLVAEQQIEVGERDAAWLTRTAAALGDDTLRIAFVGEHSADVINLVGAVLETSLGGVAPVGQIQRISFGSGNAPASGSDLTSPTPWLAKNRAEVLAVPGFDKIDASQLEDVIHQSDLVVLATRVANRLTSPRETEFLSKYIASGKSNVIVTVDGLQQEGSETLNALESVRERLNFFAPKSSPGQPPLAIVPVDTHKALEARRLLKSLNPAGPTPSVFLKDLESSGVRDVELSIVSHIDTPADRVELKRESAIFTATQALTRLQNTLQSADTALQQALDDLDSSIARVLKTKERLVRDFRGEDLAVVNGSTTALRAAVREYFTKVPFWKLVWRNDFVADDLKVRMREHTLLQAEYQMVYAMGKLNEGARSLRETVLEQVDAVLDPKSHISAASNVNAIKDLLLELERTRILIIRQGAARPLGPSTSEAKSTPESGSLIFTPADPFLLRNRIATFDATRHCDDLQRDAQKLVVRQALFQGALYTTLLLVTHFGVPLISVGLPVALISSGAGLAWMRLRWRLLEQRFWGRVSNGHDTLKEDILTAFEQTTDQHLVEPVAGIVKVIRDAVDERRHKVVDLQAAVDAGLTRARELRK
ncbi:uncharacterized protein EV422DRAFT_196268 [Fimicolochytrium jonesii]|uniref:uncharacterized protein n=1 Tax=Fimicolochytrium jonesii TaxID=1396493 RepID=UPI0022FE0F7E|nr:uncharacterized protein EV422DRAFT_196268 [Fimicolochytrium jonesii]KAI8818260.1 hypothetical protein EV422DRAFT_196268 [Fimicolochytrium jonesii]